MRIIVTRVQPQHWVQSFCDQGHEAIPMPLIQVGPVQDTSALTRAWQHWSSYVGVMFVSPHAVQYFFESKPPLTPVNLACVAINTRVWATGPGTRDALLACGVAADLIDAPPQDGKQFDSEALWQQVNCWVKPGAKVLIVRGNNSDGHSDTGSGRNWFAQQVQQAQAHVDFVVAYQRIAPHYSTTDLVLAAHAANDGSIWVFSSTEAVNNLKTLLPEQDWSCARAVATHARIATATRQLGFGRVNASKPTPSSVLSSLESLV